MPLLSRAMGHLRHNVVAYLALFVALGGTSYAAVRLPRNSVGSTQLRKNAVTSAKIRNGSVASADLSSAVRAALRRTGAQGPAGPQGPAGASTPQTIGDGSIGPEKLAAPAAFIGVGPTNIPVAANTNTAVPILSEVLSRGVTHDAGSDRVRVQRAGTYVITGAVELNGGSITGTNAEGRRAWLEDCTDATLRYADSTTRTVVGFGFDALNVSTVVALPADACVHLVVRAGQAVTLGSNGNRDSGLQLVYVGA